MLGYSNIGASQSPIVLVNPIYWILLDDDNMIYIVHVFKVVMSHPLDITRNHQFNAGLKEGSKRCNNSETVITCVPNFKLWTIVEF